jgi:hypothetical protein
MWLHSPVSGRHRHPRPRTRLTLERLEDRWVPSAFSLNGTVLTINGTSGDDHFQMSQRTVHDNNIFFSTSYTFTMNGETASYLNYRQSEFGPLPSITQVIVEGNGGNDTGVLITDDTHTDPNGMTQETHETAILGPGGGALYVDDPNVDGPFLQFNGFNNTYAYMGRADSAQLTGNSGGGNILVTAGDYSYITGGGQFHLISGAPSVYGYAASSTDQVWHYDAAGGLDSFVASGSAYSYLSGTGSNGNTFFNEAVGFAVAYGIATHGNAIAYMIDSPYNDVFAGYASYSYLSGPGVFNVAEGFSLVYGQSFVGGYDFAYNFDPSHNVLTGFHMLT